METSNFTLNQVKASSLNLPDQEKITKYSLVSALTNSLDCVNSMDAFNSKSK